VSTVEITEWVEGFLESQSLGDYYLVDVVWKPKTQKLKLFVDSDEGITLGECQRLSRSMEESLDSNKILGESYSLDVSSPGTERPLKLRRQYKKNIGRVILVEGSDETQLIGKLVSISDEGITVQPEIKKEKSKKATYGEEKQITWENIKQTIVQIRF